MNRGTGCWRRRPSMVKMHNPSLLSVYTAPIPLRTRRVAESFYRSSSLNRCWAGWRCFIISARIARGLSIRANTPGEWIINLWLLQSLDDQSAKVHPGNKSRLAFRCFRKDRLIPSISMSARSAMSCGREV